MMLDLNGNALAVSFPRVWQKPHFDKSKALNSFFCPLLLVILTDGSCILVCYSLRNEFTGFAVAARSDLRLTVSQAMINTSNPPAMNKPGESVTR